MFLWGRHDRCVWCVPEDTARNRIQPCNGRAVSSVEERYFLYISKGVQSQFCSLSKAQIWNCLAFASPCWCSKDQSQKKINKRNVEEKEESTWGRTLSEAGAKREERGRGVFMLRVLAKGGTYANTVRITVNNCPSFLAPCFVSSGGWHLRRRPNSAV